MIGVTWEEWAAREREARQALRVPAQRPVPLLPAERFSHRKPDPEIAAWITREKTSAIENRLARSCAGWARRPTATCRAVAFRVPMASTNSVLPRHPLYLPANTARVLHAARKC